MSGREPTARNLAWAKRLIALCAEEGQLPADIISSLCESAGCLDALEELRGA